MAMYSRKTGATSLEKKRFMIKGLKESLTQAKQQVKAIQAQLKVWQKKQTK